MKSIIAWSAIALVAVGCSRGGSSSGPDAGPDPDVTIFAEQVSDTSMDLVMMTIGIPAVRGMALKITFDSTANPMLILDEAQSTLGSFFGIQSSEMALGTRDTSGAGQGREILAGIGVTAVGSPRAATDVTEIARIRLQSTAPIVRPILFSVTQFEMYRRDEGGGFAIPIDNVRCTTSFVYQ